MREDRVCGERLQARGRWDSFNPRRCDKPAVEEVDDKWLCKRHATVARKRKERFAQWDREHDADNAFRQEVRELAERHGVDVQTDYDSIRRRIRHDRVSVALDDLKKLLAVPRPPASGGREANPGGEPDSKERNA